MEKRWVIKEKGDMAVVKHLAGASWRIRNHLQILWLSVILSSAEEASAFFNPSLDYLHDPFLMKDMNIAVEGFLRQ